MNQSPNPNLLWAETFVDGLAHAGLRAVCIAPGSRSTPLALACDAHPALQVYLHLDERSAGFFALGMALATEAPVALACTSGTAAVELHPAIVEAHQAGVPLLVLTADRPPELRHSGANQTIDQVKMYGDHVLWAVDAALPEKDAPEVAVRNLRTLAARAYTVANGLRQGPVHVNFPFRKPLEPDPPYRPAFAAGRTTFTRMERGLLQPTATQIEELAALIDGHERGLIVCGPRGPGGDFPGAVAELARRCGYPILADPLSGVRFGPHVADAPVVGGYETFLVGDPGWAPPEVVLRFGAAPTSQRLDAYLDRTAPPHQVHVRADGVWADASHRVTHCLQADATAVCRALADAVTPRTDGPWTGMVMATEQANWTLVRSLLRRWFFDGAAVAAVVAALPAGANLCVGNSLPVRHLDQFAPPSSTSLHIYANRGASGIDGVTSTALGVAAADRDAPTVLVIGDISFYHDLNGLLAVRQQGLGNVTIVLLHNDGGGIFRRLPIAHHEPPFTRLFRTPHGLDFGPAIRMYGLAHVRADDRTGLEAALAEQIGSGRAGVIEVRTDSARDEERRREIVRQTVRHIVRHSVRNPWG